MQDHRCKITAALILASQTFAKESLSEEAWLAQPEG